MAKIDPIRNMLRQKIEARAKMTRVVLKAKTKGERAKWRRWIKKVDKEIDALRGVLVQLEGIDAVKRTIKAHFP